jgi:hypothetical protein
MERHSLKISLMLACLSVPLLACSLFAVSDAVPTPVGSAVTQSPTIQAATILQTSQNQPPEFKDLPVTSDGHSPYFWLWYRHPKLQKQI